MYIYIHIYVYTHVYEYIYLYMYFNAWASLQNMTNKNNSNIYDNTILKTTAWTD